MSKPIHQSVTFPAKAAKLFHTFLDSKAHAAVVGSNVSITRREGARWKAFDGMLFGRNLRIVPGRLIVQSWRSSGWNKSDGDSILVLAFSDTKKGGRIDLTHVNVPAHDRKGVTKGWKTYYWRPWKKRLAA